MAGCAVNGCEKESKPYSKWCSGHTHRNERYGSPTGKPEPRLRPTCTVDGCNKPNNAHGYCLKHYRRFINHGSPVGGGPMRGASGDTEKFLASLSLNGTDDCVQWPFARTKDGYGRLTRDGKAQGVHNYVARQHRGEPPSKLHEACHSCGNGAKACVNPKHIYWGTRKENVRDSIEHGTFLAWGRPVTRKAA